MKEFLNKKTFAVASVLYSYFAWETDEASDWRIFVFNCGYRREARVSSLNLFKVMLVIGAKRVTVPLRFDLLTAI